MTPAIALEWLFSVAPWAIRLGALIVVPFRRSPVATQSWLLVNRRAKRTPLAG